MEDLPILKPILKQILKQILNLLETIRKQNKVLYLTFISTIIVLFITLLLFYSRIPTLKIIMFLGITCVLIFIVTILICITKGSNQPFYKNIAKVTAIFFLIPLVSIIISVSVTIIQIPMGIENGLTKLFIDSDSNTPRNDSLAKQYKYKLSQLNILLVTKNGITKEKRDEFEKNTLEYFYQHNAYKFLADSIIKICDGRKIKTPYKDSQPNELTILKIHHNYFEAIGVDVLNISNITEKQRTQIDEDILKEVLLVSWNISSSTKKIDEFENIFESK